MDAGVPPGDRHEAGGWRKCRCRIPVTPLSPGPHGASGIPSRMTISALPGLGAGLLCSLVPCSLADKVAKHGWHPHMFASPFSGKGFTPQLLASWSWAPPSLLSGPCPRDFHPSSLNSKGCSLTPRTLQATPVGNPAAQVAHRYSEPQMPLVCQVGMSQGHL